MRVQHVEVVLELKSEIGQSSSSGSLCVGGEEETDALRRFCHHKENVLLSTPWANGITHVGQRFVGGAQEFRDVLCKYVIQSGFQFTYGMDVRTSKNPRVSSDLVSSTISEIVRNKPLTWPCEVVAILKRDYGLDVSYHVVWLGVEKAKAVIHGDHSLSFDQLRWYSDTVMRYNPGSYVNIDYDASSQQFCHFFVSFATCIYGFNSCRPLLFLDEIFLKGKYKGLFPVTFVIVDSETTANWSWFLYELGKVVDDKRQITFISDRNLGLLEAMSKNNLRDRMKGIDNGFRDHSISSLGDCAYEPTVVGFHEKLEKLKEKGKQQAHSFFKELAPEGIRYREMTSNAAESFNNWIKEARNLPITQLVDTIHTQLIRQMSWQVSKANEDVFEVHSMSSVTIDIVRCMYSCFKWQINEFPCDHAVIARRAAIISMIVWNITFM
ncbi:uncharacterized protein LOC114301307 [Camellia sinensis]|uniref:uncharacterized protein LOC114301307 n=1 Tax=Camellia sinensis TaxID=4442 RepID=UPI0010366D18|nr:uncharacterized protein LOC114301307 [Camellia sinensis]